MRAVAGHGIEDPKQQELITASEEHQLSSALPVHGRLQFCPGFAMGLHCDFEKVCV